MEKDASTSDSKMCFTPATLTSRNPSHISEYVLEILNNVDDTIYAKNNIDKFYCWNCSTIGHNSKICKEFHHKNEHPSHSNSEQISLSSMKKPLNFKEPEVIKR
ncbi:hypothetical protein APICC_02901 [Apis cerana cerana]|uniref:Uncharacterized protein n=1 Tax=Apis cerana cerana TaxID=94128 RepID=A0A2A3EGC9_APICC|nr:hypothetical protein APICC_02901 [Apis cerana cerana]